MESDDTIYICKLIVCLGKNHIIEYNKKQEMWETWVKFRNNLFEKNDKIGINNILKSVYELKNYDPEETLKNWGCIGDIYCKKSDVSILDKKNIYSPIKILFESYISPPFAWCKYMQSKGFIINLFFLNLDGDKSHITKNCGTCLYSFNNLILENYCIIPKIDTKKFNRYTSLKRIKYYINNIYTEERICHELNLLLELYDIGSNSIANKIYNELTNLPKLIENMELNNRIDIDDINIDI